MANPAYYQPGLVTQAVQQREHLLHLHIYQQSWQNQKSTVKPGLPFEFGENVSIDWAVYDDVLPKGKIVARAQGVQIGAGTTERRWFISFNLVFTDARFRGSGLKVEGAWLGGENLEWAIVGGTGEFGRAQGTATYKYIEESNGGVWDINFRFACPILTQQTGAIKVLPPVGGDGGREVDVTAKPRSLESVTIRYGDIIDSISFSYTDDAGKKQTDDQFGGNGGTPITIKLKPNETVKRIMGTTGDFEQNMVVTSLRIITNLDTYGPYGKENGTRFAIPEKDHNAVVGFYGRASLFLHAIGVYAIP